MGGDFNTARRGATNHARVWPGLGRGEVRVRYAFTDGLVESDCAAAGALLSEPERARCRRLILEEDRVSFVVAHALLRTALSEVAAPRPREWRFATSAGGRPEIEAPLVRPRLRFSLSHTRGLVACAVTEERDVGLDVERVLPWAGSGGLAERCLSSSEKAAVAALPPPEARTLFFGLWTLKEAYAKAQGLGLRLPFDAASFHIAPGAPPAVSFAPGHGEDARGWQFALLEPRPGYQLAVGARREAGAGIDFTIVRS
jgi:4'-phosphopantetheinyl transferase